jgi:hypothetical protein
VKKSWRQAWCISTGNWFEITIYGFSGEIAGSRAGVAALSNVRVAGTLDVTELTQKS